MNDRAEQAVRLIVRPGGEEQRVHRPCASAVAEAKRPKALDLQGRPAGTVQHAEVLILAVVKYIRRIVGVNAAVAEVADEQVVAEGTEVSRRQRQPPRRVSVPSRRDAANQVAAGVERVHESMAHSRDVVLLVFVPARR